ncbi:MAG: FAD-binding protein, partial [Bacteroidetes bacterium]|nr:FAD-binding protein [Bacteroidota bacterium]
MMKKEIANWGNYPVIESDERKFSFTEEIQKYVKQTDGFIPRGNGRCYGDASLAKNTISLLNYD